MIIRRLRPSHWLAVDAVAALLLAAAFGLASWLAEGGRWSPALAVVLVATLPLAVRRHLPLPVLALTLAAAVTAPALGWDEPYVAVAVAAHAVALLEPRRVAAVALAGSLVATAAGFAVADWTRMPGETLFGWLLIALAWTVGLATREQRAYAARAAALAARRAIEQERLRIARDLHDVIAHSLSVISSRAGIAAHLAPERPEEAERALTLIGEISRSARADIRHLLGHLREPGTPAPEPLSLEALPDLAARAREAGVEVDLRVEPGLRVPDALALTVYRISQEALSNVVRHAAPTRCDVSLTLTPEGELDLRVVDDGRTAGHGPPGFGLLGMRERAESFGGSLSAGARPTGGFAVHARFPMGRQARFPMAGETRFPIAGQTRFPTSGQAR
ncbi:two-component sensor histidine kinase [Sinosporangium siamense]|uniref:histidine kinase n=1 Tax=Sinosporangium siamense TaxID=1367973 RepID=A0A919RPA9_9ACTN|nr:two-component sensor histidine kinase [Sinosporangium siamense]